MPSDDLFDRALTRRALLRAGLGASVATAGAVLLPSLTSAAFGSDPRAPVAIPFSSDVYASPDPQRFTLVLQQATNGGVKFVSGPPMQVRIKGPTGTWQPFTEMRLDREGLPKGRGVYRGDFVFDAPGKWQGQVNVGGRRVNGFTLKLSAVPVAPVPGQPAPRAASPTAADSLGVNPICTRTPPCPLHTTSLSDVIGTGKPVAVMFATPALCLSQFCGPVLDEMLAVMGPYEERVQFVHVDIYKSLQGAAKSPTVEAWNLPSEPWLFGIDGAGTITARLDTAFGKTEMVALLDDLIAA